MKINRSTLARTLDLAEAADFLKVSKQTAAEFAARGELPGCKIGVAWVFLEEALVRYIEEQTAEQQRERRLKSGIEGEAFAKGLPAKVGRRKRCQLPDLDHFVRLPPLSPEAVARDAPDPKLDQDQTSRSGIAPMTRAHS